MRSQCGIFYYEMRVISKGDDGYIGIGFCAATNKLERLPGKHKQIKKRNHCDLTFVKAGILILGDTMETMDIHLLDLALERTMGLVFRRVM
jgi:hypothetical protein